MSESPHPFQASYEASGEGTVSMSTSMLPPAVGPSGFPSRPPPGGDAGGTIEATVVRLRAELGGADDRVRKARLLAEMAELEERAGDEPSAARDYLAAYNAEPSFREPLEALLRLLERRRSLKNLARIVEALVKAADTPEERARALLLRAAFLEDVADDTSQALVSAQEAARTAPGLEASTAWMTLELLAGRLRDAVLREDALLERAARSTDPTWKGLLLLDGARLALARADAVRARSLLEQARGLEAGASFAASQELERVGHAAVAEARGERERREALLAWSAALEDCGALVHTALADAGRGAALGVPAHACTAGVLVDTWLRAAEALDAAGEAERAAALLARATTALAALVPDEDAARGATLAPLLRSRLRLATRPAPRLATNPATLSPEAASPAGDGVTAASLAAELLRYEPEGPDKATYALRLAEQALANGDADGALEHVRQAAATGSVPARVKLVALLAEGKPGEVATALEELAATFSTDVARGRAHLAAAYLHAAYGASSERASEALERAAKAGVRIETVARFGRLVGSILGDAALYEASTERLLATAVPAEEAIGLSFELFRTRLARSDEDGARVALRALATTGSGWLGRVLTAFAPALPGPASERTAALDELARRTADPSFARGLALAAARRAREDGDVEGARGRLRDVLATDAGDTLAASYLLELERAVGSAASAARVAVAAAEATEDPELAGALWLEAGVLRWRSGDRKGAADAFARAQELVPAAGQEALAWASRGLDVDAVDGRRRALDRSVRDDALNGAATLERFGLELGAAQVDAALAALARAETEGDGDVALAAALARLGWSPAGSEGQAVRDAVMRIAALGAQAASFAAVEQLRLARETGDADEMASAARTWLDAGGGLEAGIEGLAAAMRIGRFDAEEEARWALAGTLEGEAKEAVRASAALLRALTHHDEVHPSLLVGRSGAVRLTNLELAPAGCDPRRRATALTELGDVLGDEAANDAFSLAGWSQLVAGDAAAALQSFRRAAEARGDDLGAWEGLRSAAGAVGDLAEVARAAGELGSRCRDASRGAAFWEEAAHAYEELGQLDLAERAYERSFSRDPGRSTAFDPLFRRVRERREGDRMIELITRRLEVTDEPKEIAKLFWEQARVLRERGDVDQALRALENVTMLEPEHVGALALSGEIFIRKQRYAEAAEALAQLAQLEAAPPKNRVTAGITAVDLYEHKLSQPGRALEVLIALHRANLSTLPVRERLAKAAARMGAWAEATSVLEALMHERAEAEGRVEAARLALVIHRDRTKQPKAARAAVHKLLDESPGDAEALELFVEIEDDPPTRRAYLHRARETLLSTLEQRPSDKAAARCLAKVARASGEDTLQAAALTVALATGGSEPDLEQAFAQLTAKRDRVPKTALGPSNLQKLLHPGDGGPLAELFALLGVTVGEALGPSLAACGVGKRDRVDPRAGLALRNEIAAWAGALGIETFDLYIGGKDPLGVQGVAGETPALVVGSGVNAPLGPAIRARVARELLALLRGTTVLRVEGDAIAMAIVAVACKLAEVPAEAPAFARMAEVERQLNKVMSRKTKKLLPDLCRAIVASRADVRAFAQAARGSQNRMALVAAGDVGVVLADTLGEPLERLPSAIPGERSAEDLLRFALSQGYFDVRRALGLERTA